jgi:hypothetical protein
VEGLPQSPGPIGLTLLVIGLTLGALFAWRIRARTVSALEGATVVAWIVLSATAVTLGSTPFVAWRIVEDIRYTSGIDPWLRPRYGVSVFKVHPEIFDNAKARIPAGDTYYLAPSKKVEYTSRSAFRLWALGYLLPRVAVAEPDRAAWIVTLGRDPRSVGPPVSKVWLLKEPVNGLPAAYLGKVQR